MLRSRGRVPAVRCRWKKVSAVDLTVDSVADQSVPQVGRPTAAARIRNGVYMVMG